MPQKTHQEIEGLRRKILRYPEKTLTQSEFDKLPRNVDREFLNFSPIGSWFVYKPIPEIPDIQIVGQIVKGDDLFAEQWGAGLSVPKRGINRYRIIIQ
jgi:hypothetical protein